MMPPLRYVVLATLGALGFAAPAVASHPVSSARGCLTNCW
jgi:hypothetical protein